MNNMYLGSGSNGISTPNEVLKKTYFLLALSLIPTVIGTVLGMKLGIMHSLYGALGGLGFFIVYMISMFALFYGIKKAGDSPIGVSLLMFFTFISGVMLSISIEKTLKIPNGAALIGTAFGGTMLIFFGMAIASQFIKRDLSFMGKFLFIALIALLCGSILFIFFPSMIFYVILTVGILILFSVYLLYDLNQIIMGGERSYVMATLNVYIDVLNIFRSILSLLGIFGRDD